MNHKVFTLFILLISAVFSEQLFSQDLPVYSAELFYPVENTPDFYSEPDFGGGKSLEDAVKTGKNEVLKEAVFLFSGMLYGFKFQYIPGDKRRGVDEVFEIIPIETIEWGDPRLKIRGLRKEENRDWISFSYYPDETMKSWIMYWSSGSFPRISGSGEGAFLKGFDGKEDAVKQAVKEAVRNYMRSREHNKPQRIEGEFTFLSPPVFNYTGGIYSASVKIKINIDKVSEYGVY